MENDGVDRSNHLHLSFARILWVLWPLEGREPMVRGLGLWWRLEKIKRMSRMQMEWKKCSVAAPPRPPWDYTSELGLTGHGRGH